jgi:valine--pyruvate aminotransferase
VSLRLSAFGRRFARHTGALELMDDLGRAVSGEDSALLLGGGNPGRIPAVEAVFRARLHEIANDADAYGRAIANYAHPAGESRLRSALAALFREHCGWDVTAENIALTAGSQASFFLLFNMFAGEMEDGRRTRVLLPMTPEYVGYADLGLDEDLFVALRPNIEMLDEAMFKYHVDFDALEIDDEIGVVCVSRPTNPTGNVVTDDELVKLDELCRAASVPLIVDNAYGLPFPGIVFVDATPIWNENIVYCMSLSKIGLPGVRTGIVVARQEIVASLTQMMAVLNLAVGSVGPVLVQPLVANGEILKMAQTDIRPFYEHKSKLAVAWLREALRGIEYRIHKPEGAIFLWLWLPGLPLSSQALYRRLKAAGVLVLSGHYFFPGLHDDWTHRNECLRISFAMDEATVRQGIEIIGRELRKICVRAG